MTPNCLFNRLPRLEIVLAVPLATTALVSTLGACEGRSSPSVRSAAQASTSPTPATLESPAPESSAVPADAFLQLAADGKTDEATQSLIKAWTDGATRGAWTEEWLNFPEARFATLTQAQAERLGQIGIDRGGILQTFARSVAASNNMQAKSALLAFARELRDESRHSKWAGMLAQSIQTRLAPADTKGTP